jgi:hypothetical protein
MYWSEIIYFLTWPLLIFVSYHAVVYYLKKLDKKLTEDGEIE